MLQLCFAVRTVFLLTWRRSRLRPTRDVDVNDFVVVFCVLLAQKKFTQGLAVIKKADTA